MSLLNLTTACSIWILLYPSLGMASEQGIDFDSHIRPILKQHCISCHGPEKQKGGLRLDNPVDARRGGDSELPAVLPKNVEGSQLLVRVKSKEADTRMPPNGKTLEEKQIALLRQWIANGAVWPVSEEDKKKEELRRMDHWAWKSMQKPVLPPKSDWARNEIDRFIEAKLKTEKLNASKEADRRTLIRRLYFDLVGLPPKPEDIEAFLKDGDPRAYEKLVDKLLASPQYGERWARHWLDVVHFGETHGYDKDKPRPYAWPYRDYVIRSLNQDKPYGRFVQEQIAGDVLFPGTVDGIEALGFISAGPWDFIGHAELPEDKIDGKVARHLDRDDMVANTMSSFMSLTVHCAQCHNHKFDPILQEDYYRLQAVFAALDRADQAYDADPRVARQRSELQKREGELAQELKTWSNLLLQKIGKPLADLDARLIQATKANGKSLRPEYGYHSQLASERSSVKWVQIDLRTVVTLDRVILYPCYDDFNGIGAGFGFPVRFRVELANEPEFKNKLLIADQTVSDFQNPGLKPVRLPAGNKAGRYLRITATKLAARMNDYNFALAEVEAVDALGKNLAAKAPVTALDSIEAPTRWAKANLTDGIYPPSSESVVDLRAEREKLIRDKAGQEILESGQLIEKKQAAIRIQIKALPPQQRAYIGCVYSGSGTFVGTGASGGLPRAIHILPRGDVTKPGKIVGAGAISAFSLPSSFDLPPQSKESDRRAALAKWLTDKENPLVWRSIVNRVWQYHFGKGLVDSPNDFGRMGQTPTHPELLDYLAIQFRDNGQSIKELHRSIVNSATYRQSSESHPEFEKRDADNRYLWRQNRRKLEAEAIRDAILFVSGQLDFSMGGPSFQDFVIEKPEHSPHYEYQLYDPEDPKSHRRSVYRFVVRSKSQPFMAALDCADPALSVDKRNQTLSPQQALALLNNRLTLVMAKHFADRVEKQGDTFPKRIDAAYQMAFGRTPTETERVELTKYAEKYGLANTCRVILNLNEFIFVD